MQLTILLLGLSLASAFPSILQPKKRDTAPDVPSTKNAEETQTVFTSTADIYITSPENGENQDTTTSTESGRMLCNTTPTVEVYKRSIVEQGTEYVTIAVPPALQPPQQRVNTEFAEGNDLKNNKDMDDLEQIDGDGESENSGEIGQPEENGDSQSTTQREETAESGASAETGESGASAEAGESEGSEESTEPEEFGESEASSETDGESGGSAETGESEGSEETTEPEETEESGGVGESGESEGSEETTESGETGESDSTEEPGETGKPGGTEESGGGESGELDGSEETSQSDSGNSKEEGNLAIPADSNDDETEPSNGSEEDESRTHAISNRSISEIAKNIDENNNSSNVSEQYSDEDLDYKETFEIINSKHFIKHSKKTGQPLSISHWMTNIQPVKYDFFAYNSNKGESLEGDKRDKNKH